jgi:aminopeptidase N
MENTTATLHGDYVQATPRELLDANYNAGRSTIAHELFHQWFGDLVTAESWSNLTVNESFADFSEMLWAEHKYGKDEADAHSYTAMLNYLANPANKTKDLVRFHYDDKEDVFDAVTYQKGGRILNMLRNYLGNEAFYKGLGIYLKTNAFKPGEAQQLRLALEEASGRDLNWYFNQWYYGHGNPALKISYKWDDATKTETVYLQQTQDGNAFILPMAVDIYAGGTKTRHKIWMNDKADTLTFSSTAKPNLVNVDGDKVLLAEKKDSKTLDEYVFQYFNAPLYLDRFEAIDRATPEQGSAGARKIMIAALKDKYYGLRIKAIRGLNMANDEVRNAAQPMLVDISKTDDNTLVRAAAIDVLGKLKASGMMDLFKDALKSESYAVQGAALTAINLLDPAQALELAKGFEKDNKGALTLAMVHIYATAGSGAQWPFVYKQYQDAGIQNKFNMIREFAAMTAKLDKPEYALQGIDGLKDFGVKYKVYGIAPIIIGLLNDVKAQRTKVSDVVGVKAADEAISAVNAK